MSWFQNFSPDRLTDWQTDRQTDKTDFLTPLRMRARGNNNNNEPPAHLYEEAIPWTGNRKFIWSGLIVLCPVLHCIIILRSPICILLHVWFASVLDPSSLTLILYHCHSRLYTIDLIRGSIFDYVFHFRMAKAWRGVKGSSARFF